ncbi:MAG: XRE family transcriptional regulator [Nitrospiraceae bacterium]|nr:MAG: XRE family transcriptional regulator [Nitrospiraceae bacterium]
MGGDMNQGEGLGQYLKQLREGKGLSLRQVAQEAGLSSGYLSQMEGVKRGRRKSGEFFAPHPQILKKLAAVYHVPAHELLERAGYLEDEEDYWGFSEEKEIDRCFTFVIHDPVLKQALTMYEKKAVIQRYETLTGRKLITWAGDESTLTTKVQFSGLHREQGMLYADTIQQTLSGDELAHELGISPDELRLLVQHGHLKPKRGAQNDWVFDKQEIRYFKYYCLQSGLKLFKVRDRKKLPQTEEESLQAAKEVDDLWSEPARQRIRQSGSQRKQSVEKIGKKGAAKTP